VTLAQARDIALVFLAIEAIVIGFVPLVAMYFAVKGLRALRAKFLIFSRRLRLVLNRIAGKTERISGTLARPIIAIEIRRARWSGMARAVRRMAHR
jgi:hypothetical protein